MKQKFTLSLLIVFSTIFTSLNLAGQDSDESGSSRNLRIIGFGLHVEQLNVNDINTSFLIRPANKIILTLNTGDHFRLETEYGYSWLNDKKNDLKSKNHSIGLGAFGMFQRGKTNIYMGIRLEYSKIIEEIKIYSDLNSYDYLSSPTTAITNRYIINPVIGAEYNFAKHFSFGGEVGLKYMILNGEQSSNYGQYYDSDKDIFTTSTGLFLRFYF